jgi:putative flippase GtrA
MAHWIKFNVVGALGFLVQSVALYALTRSTSYTLSAGDCSSG